MRAEDSVNRGVGTIIHEFGHVIAFISFSQVQSRYVAIDRNLNAYVWTGPKVMEKAKEYYGCRGSMKGVPLQNNNGSVGGHWDESHLSNELMTPTTGSEAEMVSGMTLALCEDTGWYKADYSYVENFKYGENQGCTYAAKCPSPQICSPGTSGFVTSDKRGVGYCRSDSRNCAQEFKYSNRNCNNGSSWGTGSDKFGASYGGDTGIAQGKFVRSLGSRYTWNSSICAKVECGTGYGSYTFTFKNFKNTSGSTYSGDARVTCSGSGRKEFNNGGSTPASYVDCISPKTFCEARFGGGDAGPKCHETCSKNGRCQTGGNGINCWCYSDFRKTSGSCPNLREDID